MKTFSVIRAERKALRMDSPFSMPGVRRQSPARLTWTASRLLDDAVSDSDVREHGVDGLRGTEGAKRNRSVD